MMCCEPGRTAQVLLFLIPTLLFLLITPPVLYNYGDKVLFHEDYTKNLPATKFAALTLGWYALLINCFTTLMFCCDKCFAMNDEWRIAEVGLFLLICEGGIAGCWIGMIFCCHKTSKEGFLRVACCCSFFGLIFLGSYYGIIYAIYK